MRRKSRETEVDEDGFTLVKAKVSMVQPVTPSSSDSRKRKAKSEGLTDFYRVQLKERKSAEWRDTKRQQARDLERLNEMKNRNKFQL